MAGRDRAINMALRVLGVNEAARDFRRVGDDGSKAFDRVGNAAAAAEIKAKAAIAQLKAMPDVDRRNLAVEGATGVLGPVQRGGGFAAFSQRASVITASVKRSDAVVQSEADLKQLEQGLIDAELAGARMTSRLIALGRAAGIAGVAAAALAVLTYKSADAFAEHEAALDRFNAQLSLSGNLSSAAGSDIEAMARKVSETTLQTEDAALKAGNALAKVPGIAAATMSEALDASARLADALGTDVAQEAEKTGAVLTALARGDIEALKKAVKDLNPGLALTILNMAEAGDTAGATATYLEALRDAAGDGPNGLTTATNRLGKAWDNLLRSFGETDGGWIAGVIDFIASRLDNLRERIGVTSAEMLAFAKANNGSMVGFFEQRRQRQGSGGSALDAGINAGLDAFRQAQGLMLDAAAQARLAPAKKPPRERKARRSGKSDAEREAERLAREAEQAREAADRVRESNQEVISSYELRAREAQARLGLEGAALEAVVRQQEIDAAAREISTDLIAKEVEARKLSAKGNFDEAQARAEATAAVGQQTAEVRKYAAAAYDAEKAQDAFNRRMEEAKAVTQQVQTPLEEIATEVARIRTLFDEGAISAQTFERQMDRLANAMVDAAEKGGNAWEGFGEDVGRTFSDLILNGGSAKDLLQELIRLPLERLLFQNVEQPIARFIDGLTGNDRDKNVAAARATLPSAPADLLAGTGIGGPAIGGASEVAAQQITQLGVAAASAASSIGGIPGATDMGIEAPLLDMQGQAASAAAGLQQLTPAAAQLGSAFNSAIALLSGGGGGAGGLLSTVLSLGAAAVGGGGGAFSAPVTSAGTSAVYGGTLGGIYHDGGTGLPGGKQRRIDLSGSSSWRRYHDGTLGANEFHAVLQYGEDVLTRPQADVLRGFLRGDSRRREPRLAGNSAPPVIININAPATPDIRRTANEVARRTGNHIEQTRRRGLA